MKLLLRYTSRFLLDSFVGASSKTPRYSRALFLRAQASTCPQCRFLITQRRQYSQEDKPFDSKPPPDNVPSSQLNLPKPPTPIKEFTNENEDPSLPSQEESRRSRASKRLNEFMDNVQTKLFRASQRLNDLTGYASIEHLKLSIEDLESQSRISHELVRQARAHYKQMVAERAATQREVTTLLARKDTWSGEDLQRFTELYRSDHEVERKVQESAHELAEREREAEKVGVELQRGILKRYHEEQIWSDKIRRTSTWGTWGLMGVNIVLFLVVQFGFEPWRRRRLVNGFEEKVFEALSLEKTRVILQKEDEVPEILQAAIPDPVDTGIAGVQEEAGNVSGEVAAAVDAAVAVTMDEVEAAEQRLVGKLVDTEQTQTEPISTTTKSGEPPIEDISTEPSPTQKPLPRGLLDNIEISTIVTQMRDLQSWRLTAYTRDLFSNRAVELKRVDLTIIALEGVAVGAAVVGFVVTVLVRRN